MEFSGTGGEPATIGPYRIDSVLGRGGMGVVYLASDPRSGERVALKTLRRVEPSMLAAIRREAQALSAIRHPEIVRIVSHGDAEGIPWYAMELVEGVTLRNRLADRFLSGRHRETDELTSSAPAIATVPLDEAELLAPPGTGAPPGADEPSPLAPGPVPLGEALGYALRLCAPLAYLHGEGFVHRDLKPDNVLVRPDGGIVIVDFGLLQAAPTGRDVLELTEGLAGTLAYMSPEQLRGGPLDARADLYALGCILFELVVGRPPFQAERSGEMIAMHLEAPPPRPSDLVAGIPARLDEIVASLLAKDARERTGHASIVAEALAEVGADPGALRPNLPVPRPYLYRARLVGRHAAMDTLARVVDDAGRGQVRFVVLSGESGIGKTRLASEVLTDCQARGFCAAASVGAAPDVEVPPLHALRPLLRVAADACLAGGPAAHARILGPRGRILAPYAPELAALPSHEDHDEPLDLSEPLAQRRLLESLVETVRALARESPLLVVLDDVQWIDELSLDVLAALIEDCPDESLPLLVLATYRTDELRHRLELLRTQPTVVDLPLAALDRGAVGDLVADLLALTPPPPALVEFLAVHTDGNPLFVAEYLRSAVDSGAIRRDGRGRWVAQTGSGTFEELPVPESLQDLLERRIALLSPPAARILELLAVLGREPDDAALDATRADLEGLQELLSRQVLERLPSGRYRFLHDALREVAYGRIPAEGRRALHGQVAAALESLPGDARLGEAARHWEHAGDLERARTGFRDALTVAMARGALADADLLALAYLRLCDTVTTASVRVRNDRAFRILRRQGRHAEALAEHERVAEEARSLGAMQLLSLALTGVAASHHRMGRLDLAERGYEDALAAAREAGDRRQCAIALGNLGALHQDQGRLDRALQLLLESRSILRDHGDRGSEAVTLQNLGLLQGMLGNVAEAEALYRSAAAVHREMGDRYHEGFTLANLGSLLSEVGRHVEAQAVLHEALPLVSQTGDRTLEATCLVNLGASLLESEDHEPARQHLAAAVDIARSIGDAEPEADARIRLAMVWCRDGDPVRAVAECRHALELLRERHGTWTEREARGNLALCLLESGDLAAAADIAEELVSVPGKDIAPTRAARRALLARIRLMQGDLGTAAQLAQDAIEILRSGSRPLLLAESLALRGHVALARGEPLDTVVALHGEASAVATSMGSPANAAALRKIAALGRALDARRRGEGLDHGFLAADLPRGLRARPGDASPPGLSA